MFLQKVNNIEKMINSQIAVTNKKKELALEYDQLVPKLKLIQQKNKQLITEASIFANLRLTYFDVLTSLQFDYIFEIISL